MATLYDDISLGYHACGGSNVGKLYSFKPTDGSGDFTCVRATTPTRINQLGESEVVPVNTPVIDWSTGSPLLIVTVEGELTLTTPASATKIVITIDGEDVEYNNVFPTLSLPVGSITKVIATVGGTEYDLLKAYLLRVDTASGTINEQGARDLKSMYEFLDDEGLLSGLELLYLANAGIVQRTDGVLKYVRTAFDASDNDNDLDGSATASQQPRLVGGIAPLSKVAASNQYGEGRYFTHTPISFAANETWSVTVALKLDGNAPGLNYVFGEPGTNSVVYIHNTSGSISLNSRDNITKTFIGYYKPYFGKQSILSIVHNGTGGISLYINGVLKDATADILNLGGFVFNRLFWANPSGARHFAGSISHYHIQSSALTPAQVLTEYNLLRSLYPEIESVVIGTQTWASRNFEAVATPLSNVIPNVTENGAVEKITNAADREFSSDTGFWAKSTNSLINGGVCTIVSLDGSTAFIRKSSPLLTIGKWYKITVEIKRIGAGGLRFTDGSYAVDITNSVGVQTVYFKPTSTNLFGFYNLVSTITDIDIDNISIQELNWSNATEIYDAVYAATAGTTAQKEYAALKEAAAWAYHTDVNNGAIFGKVFNGYAKKLFKADMLSAAFGWHIGTDAEYQLIDDSAYALMMSGTNYWTTANGTNATGFTALGGGYRLADGTFSTIKGDTRFWVGDEDKTVQLTDNSDTVTIAAEDLRIGAYLRLVEG